MLVTVCHSTAVQKLRDLTPSTITVQPCVIDSSACREREVSSGVTKRDAAVHLTLLETAECSVPLEGAVYLR